MIQKIIKKSLSILGTAFLISLLSFAVVHFAPGNPAELLLTKGDPGNGYSKKAVEQFAERLGLDQSLPAQMKNWLGGVIKGDFGVSFKTGVPVLEEFSIRFRCTLSLAVFSAVIMIVIGVALGVLSALYNGKLLDRMVRMFIVFHMSIPNFWVGLLFLWVFSMKLHLVPSFGFHGFSSLILPGIVLGVGRSCSVIRITKSCMMENMGSLYVMTARAKGMKENAILVRHVLKNIALPILTICSMQIIGLLGGSTIIESIFGLPGIGNYLISAIRLKDMPVVAGFVFLIGIVIILINLSVDLLYLVIDPRVRLSVHGKEK